MFLSYNYQTFIHKKTFQRLNDKFHQEAFSTIRDNFSKLRTYGLIKTKIGIENYLEDLSNPILRKALTRLRLSNHSLNIEKGRHANIPRDLRYCPFCTTSVETETHFILECQMYKDERKQLLYQIPSLD